MQVLKIWCWTKTFYRPYVTSLMKKKGNISEDQQTRTLMQSNQWTKFISPLPKRINICFLMVVYVILVYEVSLSDIRNIVFKKHVEIWKKKWANTFDFNGFFYNISLFLRLNRYIFIKSNIVFKILEKSIYFLWNQQQKSTA